MRRATYPRYATSAKAGINFLRSRLREEASLNLQSPPIFAPGRLIACIAVRDEQTAIELERYFKRGSGHAFWHKRFMK